MLSADDLQVRCSVRKAKDADTKEFSESEDMTCTMRKWHGKKKEESAELLLKPIQRRTMSAMRSRADELPPVQMPKRFSSFGEGRNRFQNDLTNLEQEQVTDTIGNIKLSLNEIMVVEKMGQDLDDTIQITTLSSGHFELSTNENGRAILMAFFKANLPVEKIREGIISRTKSDVSKFSCSTTGNKTMDVEALTSSKVAERIENETLSEKIGTKVARAFSSIFELVECTCISCGGSGSSSVHPEPALKKAASPSDTKENQPQSPNQKESHQEKSSLEDCGFSLEPEPKMELVPTI